MGGPSQRQSSTSSSRLSPLAEPFKLSKPYQQQVYTHSSEPSNDNWQSLCPSVALVHPFSSLKLESDGPADCSYTVYDFGTKVPGFPYDYEDYPSEAAQDLTGYETVSVIESSHVNCGKDVSNQVCDGQISGVENESSQNKKGSGIGCLGSIDVEGKNASDSTAYQLFAKQGNNASKGSKSFRETCNDLCMGYLETFARDDQVKFRGTEQEKAECTSFSELDPSVIPLELSVSMDQYISTTSPYSCGPSQCPVDVVGGNNNNPNIVSSESENCVSQFESHKEKSSDTLFPGTNHCQALCLGKSSIDEIISPSDLAASTPPSCSGIGAFNRMEKSFCDSTLEMDFPAYLERVSTLKGEERKSQKLEIVMNVESLPMVQCKRKVAEGSNFAQDSLLMLEKDGLNQNELDKSDADEDSPCWKGLNFSPFAFRESQASDDQLDEAPDHKLHENRSEARKSLNPLAPVFVPQNIELKLCHKEIECAQNDSLPFQKCASSTPIPMSEVQTMQCDNMVRLFNWEGPKAIGPLCRDNMHKPALEPLLKGKTRSFAKVDSGVASAFLKEGFVTHTSNIGRGTNLEVPGNIINDITLPEATSVSVSAVVHVSESKSLEQWSSLGVGESTHTKVHSNVSELVSTSQRTEVDVLVNAMHSLSELLIDKCVNGYMLSDVMHDRLQVVISNLSNCTKQRERQWTSLDGSNIPGILSFSNKSAYACMNTDSLLSNKELQDARSLVSNIGNGIPQFNEKSMEAGHTEDQMSPQTVLYTNLWLEAQEALHKHKTYVARMKSKT
ncbi:hypothetical protein BT93_D2070 [Corymbia citriodora subsp. variegata]|nr:hypothetical protein BT93_D2070 [Corymbia citriodora subsp. variegata]KAF8033346.1 hypothetical protein BT93_D2070 [Corymbia citriodora subsp. variegata]KAF8033347.1 hypothetical protein BT93_D2070 [Corymbia citriodora subsp. variegata]KAF8033348.1 hypothetical protein BT93_D2070 [Corymbia citriodora subsp. variegata]KAF8033349.1 hypothetical protein BT93_D2070 [Corymbia citriodora subsp. variegata]